MVLKMFLNASTDSIHQNLVLQNMYISIIVLDIYSIFFTGKLKVTAFVASKP